MLTVKVAVAGVPLAAGVTAGALQVGAGTTAGVTEQENATLELKPATEVTVMVEVAELPAETVAGVNAVPESVKVGMRPKVAVTAWFVFSAMEQGAAPEQPAPLQPVKVEALLGVAVRVTELLVAKLPEHVPVPGQLMPFGLLVTVPAPVPASVTDTPEVLAEYTARKASGHTTVNCCWVSTLNMVQVCWVPWPSFNEESVTGVPGEA